MTEIEFIERLKGVPFSYEEYLKIGLDEDFIIEKVSAYNPGKRLSNLSEHSDNPLIRLVEDYDVSKTEIGMVWFGAQVTDTEDYSYIGKFEVDFLCVSKLTKEVVILSFDDPSSIAYRCAQNGASFLDAIIVAAKFLEACGIDDNLYNDQEAICSMAENCSELAGGNKYLNFYKVLLGCEN